MKKGTFKIKEKTKNNGWAMKEREGFFSENFGIHKEDDDRCLDWAITHLKTGLKLCSWDYLREAKLFVQRLEEKKDWPVDWGSSTISEDYRPNSQPALQIKDDVRRAINGGFFDVV